MNSRESDQLATSELVAANVNTNPVVIRRILGQLKAAGIVESRRGAGAGWSMSRAPATVTLADIAEAIAFLASDRAAWITVSNLIVDGGQVQTL